MIKYVVEKEPKYYKNGQLKEHGVGHFEMVEALEQENEEAKEIIDCLEKQNSELKKLLLRCKPYLSEWITPMDILAEIGKNAIYFSHLEFDEDGGIYTDIQNCHSDEVVCISSDRAPDQMYAIMEVLK